MTSRLFTARALEKTDYDQWIPLWIANNSGKNKEELTKKTWSRIHTPDQPVHGLGAFHEEKLIGLLHYVLHLTTGSIEPVCYMQDLYIDPTHRRQGAAKSLILELAKLGEAYHWNRIYWLAEKDNLAAQNLYKTLGLTLDFSLHVWPLRMLEK